MKLPSAEELADQIHVAIEWMGNMPKAEQLVLADRRAVLEAAAEVVSNIYGPYDLDRDIAWHLKKWKSVTTAEIRKLKEEVK